MVVGISPDADWLTDSGLEIGDGIVCDSRERTSPSNGYTIGEVAQ
jgi:NAD(P)H-nitrite reductase large subunit